MCWWRNTKDKFWFTFGITLKLRGKIVGIQQKKEWHWLWKSGIIWSRHSSALTLKWDVSVARMSKLSHFLQKELKEIYSQHLAEKMSECVACLCYGCVHAKDSSLMHNLCNMHALDRVRFCIYFALDFVDEAAIMEQYGNEVGLAALEWCDVFDPEYRRTTWIADEEWFTDVTSLVVDKWTCPCPW